jgi:hypothetical protein
MSPAYTQSEQRSDAWTDRNSGVVRAPTDWQACDPKTVVRHVPTGTLYQLYTRPGLSADAPLALDDFGARLVHVCEGYAPPVDPVLQVLQHEALLMGLHYLGLVAFADEALDAERPDGEDIPF